MLWKADTTRATDSYPVEVTGDSLLSPAQVVMGGWAQALGTCRVTVGKAQGGKDEFHQRYLQTHFEQ